MTAGTLEKVKNINVNEIGLDDEELPFDEAMEIALAEAEDMIAHPENYKHYRTGGEMLRDISPVSDLSDNNDDYDYDNLTKEEKWERTFAEAEDIIAHPENYKQYTSVKEMFRDIGLDVSDLPDEDDYDDYDNLSKAEKWAQTFAEAEDIIAHPENYKQYRTGGEMLRELGVL